MTDVTTASLRAYADNRDIELLDNERAMLRGAADVIDELCKQIDGSVRVASDALAAGSALYRAYVSLLEAGRNRLMEAGVDCDPVAVMERGDPALIAARSAFNIVLQKAGG